MKSLLALLLCAVTVSASAQWKIQPSGTQAQFRGISVVSRTVAWVVGSMGTYGRTIDGSTWQCAQLPGAEKLMFRSVSAFDADHAVLLAIGTGDQSKIFVTENGGKTWTQSWVNPDSKAFYDSVAFWDHRNGVAFSDPVDGHFPLISTTDGGLTWSPLKPVSMPLALTGEGAFSASGTCIVVSGKSDVWIATGGAAVSRVFHSSDRGISWTVAQTSIPAAKETSGIFGLRFSTPKRGIAVGGDYKDSTHGTGQIAFTQDGGATWKYSSKIFPAGLRECASYLGHQIIVVGPNGSDVSNDDGRTWTAVVNSPEGLHTCGFSGSAGWAAGDHGLIVKWGR